MTWRHDQAHARPDKRCHGVVPALGARRRAAAAAAALPGRCARTRAAAATRCLPAGACSAPRHRAGSWAQPHHLRCRAAAARRRLCPADEAARLGCTAPAPPVGARGSRRTAAGACHVSAGRTGAACRRSSLVDWRRGGVAVPWCTVLELGAPRGASVVRGARGGVVVPRRGRADSVSRHSVDLAPRGSPTGALFATLYDLARTFAVGRSSDDQELNLAADVGRLKILRHFIFWGYLWEQAGTFSAASPHGAAAAQTHSRLRSLCASDGRV